MSLRPALFMDARFRVFKLMICGAAATAGTAPGRGWLRWGRIGALPEEGSLPSSSRSGLRTAFAHVATAKSFRQGSSVVVVR